MSIETTRLRIVPLSVEQFRLLICGMEKLEEELKLTPSGNSLDTHTQQAMEGIYKKALIHPDNYRWYTNWQIILKSENKSIGSACFMKEPDENGIVEIGYGINEPYRNQGYMTEASEVICKWALQQDSVETVIAETTSDNYASHRVLQKCGMRLYRQSEGSFWWQIIRKK